MKNAKAFLGALILLGNIAVAGTALAADGVTSEDDLTPNSYCHQKFPAMTENSIASDHPVLDRSGDAIDYYGPCNEAPTGKDQVLQQKLENAKWWRNQYED
jgi:hypothetical protein